jgi:hypothetical protein
VLLARVTRGIHAALQLTLVNHLHTRVPIRRRFRVQVL